MAAATVRPATPNDAAAIAAIHVASWQHAYRGIVPDDYLDALEPGQRLPMWERLLASSRSGVHVAVVEVDGVVVGFCSVGPSDEDDPGDVMMLYTIYMHPDAMGKGYGRMLMAYAERRMRSQGASSGVLRVITANQGTRAFYEWCGWSADASSARVEDAWGQPVETIRYTKRLD